jgi:hypothetical protein
MEKSQPSSGPIAASIIAEKGLIEPINSTKQQEDTVESSY